MRKIFPMHGQGLCSPIILPVTQMLTVPSQLSEVSMSWEIGSRDEENFSNHFL